MADQQPDDADRVPSPDPPSAAGRARRARWPAALVLVWAVLAVTDLAFILPSGASRAGAPAPRGTAVPGHGRTHSPQPAGSTSASPSPASSPRTLVPVSATAFGPSGTASGDNPSHAALAIDASTATAWQTDWYASAAFGNLQTGTGLLIDMGRPVRITRVRINLGTARGANLIVRTEKTPAPPGEQGQAGASDAGGTVRLTLARPKRARYLLIWLTLLPPDSAGTFQGGIYNVTITGTP